MEQVIPLLYCKSLDATLAFYQALGFEVTYRQDWPYPYAAVQRGDITLHFAKRAKPSACLIFVSDVHPLHQSFADGLRGHYGQVPTAGQPRITRLRPEQTRFSLFDPSGNSLMYINQDEPEPDYGAASDSQSADSQSALMQALENAIFLRDTYTDDKGAARVLDLVLKRNPSADGIERARVLAARAELAVAMGDLALADTLQAELQQMALSESDRARHADELNAAARLAQWIGVSET